MNTLRRGWRLLAAFGLPALSFLAQGCAGMAAGRGAQAKLVDGKFAPSHAPAANYGPDATLTCPSTEVLRLLGNELGRRAQGKAPAQPDGQLCAAAEALLGWPGEGTPPESVMRFVSWHFGIPSVLTRVLIATIASEDSMDIAPNLADPIAQFMQTAAEPRYGVATMRAPKPGEQPVARDMRSRGEQGPQAEGIGMGTRVVLVLRDATLDLSPLPRTLPAGGTTTVSGKVLGGIQNPKVLFCDPQGKLLTPDNAAGTDFKADVKCGDKPGNVLVEIRGEVNGALTALAGFPIACGGTVPSSVAVPNAGAAADVAADELKVFEQINAERAAGGLKPLEWDPTVAKAARAMADGARQQIASGQGVALDPVAKLKEVGFVSPVVLVNPNQSISAEEAQAHLALSAVTRCNMLNGEITHAGVGVSPVPAAKPNQMSTVLVSEVLVKELGQVDAKDLDGKLRATLAEKRAAARAKAVKQDPMLDDIAQKYAAALAASGGKEDKEKTSTIVRPLYEHYSTVDVIGGARAEPMEILEDPGIIKEGKLYGLGVAQGNDAVLGNNAVYVIVIIGKKK